MSIIQRYNFERKHGPYLVCLGFYLALLKLYRASAYFTAKPIFFLFRVIRSV